MFGSESAIRPGSLQRADALGLLRQLLATDVVDAEGLDDDEVGEERTEGKQTNGISNNDIKERDGCETLKKTRTLFTLSHCGVPTLKMCG